MDEPTLGDFVGEEADDEPAEGTEATDQSAGGGPVPSGDTAVASTYRWAPEGAACPACGATVEGRWRTDEGFVCGECYEW